MQFGILTVDKYINKKENFDLPRLPLAEAINAEFDDSTIISKVVPDEIADIKFQLSSLCDSGCVVIFTVGGTGFALQDVTPKATKLVKKETLGLVNAMISESLVTTKLAMLAHPVCDIVKKTLIIHLGDHRCAVDCFSVIKDTLEPAVALIKDAKDSIRKKHPISTIVLPSDVQTSSLSKVKLDSVAHRLKKSYPLLEVSDACDIIIKEISPSLETEVIPYEDSINKVLAENIFVRTQVPPFPVSKTNGYAVNSSDKQKNRTVRAGDKSFQEELKEGEAFRVYTGAPIPPGADAVILEEDTSFVEQPLSGKVEISVKINPVTGQHMRTVGSDVKPDSLVLRQFDLITPTHIEVLAALRITEVKVFKQPSIAVISTGNEMKDPRENLKPGQIPDCNKIGIITFLQKYGFNPVDGGIIKADPNRIKSAFAEAFSNHDVVIASSGLSTGEFDILKEVLIEDFSAIIHFERVNMTPGDFTFATLKYKRSVKYFFGFPARMPCNVALIIFIIPALRYMNRRIKYKFPVLYLNVHGLTNVSSKPEYQMVNVSFVNGSLQGNKVNQVNSLVNSMVPGNGLALVPKTITSVGTYSYQVICFNSIIPL